jgi:hypothetical protein
MRNAWRFAVLFFLTVLGMGSPVPAEEGKWTLDNPPAKQIREKYGFVLTPEWLDHIRFSSVRFNDGGSGSFVINKSGQIVGLIFDGNIESLGGRYIYSEADKRAVAVDTAAMTEALRKRYGAQDLVNEMMPGKFPALQ